jgi:hypothetical protein
MPNYKNAKIYKLWSPEGDEIYIGSTTQKLCDRKAKHNDNYKRNLNCSSKILFDKYNDVKIELLECCPCDNKEELAKKEGEYIRNNNCVNKFIAGRTKREYREDNIERFKKYEKDYREDNKEKIKEWRENNKEKINECSKEWKENNKEKIKEYNKEYYENNKDKVNKKITCECGRTITLVNKTKHERTKVHQDAII